MRVLEACVGAAVIAAVMASGAAAQADEISGDGSYDVQDLWFRAPAGGEQQVMSVEPRVVCIHNSPEAANEVAVMEEVEKKLPGIRFLSLAVPPYEGADGQLRKEFAASRHGRALEGRSVILILNASGRAVFALEAPASGDGSEVADAISDIVARGQ